MGAHEPYFDGGLVQVCLAGGAVAEKMGQMRKAGKFTYFSSRNNNFSNRNQAGFICVGNGQCPANEGCQEAVEQELINKQRTEAADGTELLEMEADPKQPVAEACDAECVATLRAQVASLQQKLAEAN